MENKTALQLLQDGIKKYQITDNKYVIPTSNYISVANKYGDELIDTYYHVNTAINEVELVRKQDSRKILKALDDFFKDM